MQGACAGGSAILASGTACKDTVSCYTVITVGK